ncbi:MAG: hypothetical protein ACI9DK_002173 [Vicingaceae bacterium]|jgi:hypothetical protein
MYYLSLYPSEINCRNFLVILSGADYTELEYMLSDSRSNVKGRQEIQAKCKVKKHPVN